MFIRALQPEEESLFREAYEWTRDAPKWLKALDSIFGWKTFEDYYKQAREENQVSFGVFENELVALVALVERAKGLFEAELSARRGTDIRLIAQAVREVGNALVSSGQVECFIWVAKRNRPVLRMCEVVGFKRTGISLFKGSYKERVIEWLKLSSNNKGWALNE
jgi:hypothetical protein